MDKESTAAEYVHLQKYGARKFIEGKKKKL